jgi:hypothetical protein
MGSPLREVPRSLPMAFRLHYRRGHHRNKEKRDRVVGAQTATGLKANSAALLKRFCLLITIGNVKSFMKKKGKI